MWTSGTCRATTASWMPLWCWRSLWRERHASWTRRSMFKVREVRSNVLGLVLHLPFSFSSGAILYISFVNATKLYGCNFFGDLVPAVKIMNPLASLFAAVEKIEDFGYFNFEPFGNFLSYEHSGLSLTMINVPTWQRVEEILSSQVNVTASMTPCKKHSLD